MSKINGYEVAGYTIKRTLYGDIVQRVLLVPNECMPEPSPYERGFFDRFQDGYRKPAIGKRR